MGPGDRRTTGIKHQTRGQSEVIGVILIVGMVLLSAGLIVISGSNLLNDLREGTAQESTTNTIEEIDTKLSSVSSVSGRTRVEISLGDSDPNRYRIVKSGYINVSANRNTTCTEHIPLTSIQYSDEDGDKWVFEAGGLWKQPRGSTASVMHTPPDLTWDKGTLSLTVVNISGTIDDEFNLVYENTTKSKRTSKRIRETLFTGNCARPNNVTITVSSEYYRAWSRYLSREINSTSLNTYDGNQSVSVYLNQSKLPEETDDQQNNVIDLNDSALNDVKITNTSIKVNKSADNTYTTIITPLTSGSTQVGEIRTVEAGQAFRPPMDVVFVMDKSGSMAFDPDSDGDTKMEEAEVAAQAFVGQMNDSFDRAGVAGFDYDGEIKITANGEYVTSDFSDATGVNGSIASFPDAPSGGTDIGSGLAKANAMMGLLSNSSRTKVIILLGDGKNDEGGSPSETELNQKAFDEAEEADRHGITIHSIGFGNPDNATMETIANTTGGTYRYVDDSDELADVFIELFSEIATSKQIVRQPITMELDAGGTTFFPQIDGNTTHIANTSTGNLNLNDPLAPSEFSYSIDVAEGENVSMTAFDYDCNEWRLTDIVHENQSTGKEYAEVRCTEIDEATATEISPSNASIYIDGDNVSSLISEPNDWWQEDLQNDTLAPYLEADNVTLDLPSNTAVVVFGFDDDDPGQDRMMLLFRIGESKENAVPKYLFNIEVRYLVVGEEA